MKYIFTAIFSVAALTTVGLLVVGVEDKSLLSSIATTDNQPDLKNDAPEWKAGPFELTNDRGQSFRSDSLLGKVWVANFIFTSCKGPCPILVEKFRTIHKEFGSHPDFRLVSISVDPETDTPEVLRAYRNEHQALAPNWDFLTGEKANVLNVMRQMFKVPVDENPEIHTMKFLLVDKRGRIIRAFNSDDAGDLTQLREQLHQMLGSES